MHSIETLVDNAVKLIEFVKISSGIRTNPHKNNADISKPLVQIRKDIKAARENVMRQSVPDRSEYQCSCNDFLSSCTAYHSCCV